MTLSDRLLKFAKETRRTARSLPPGKQRQLLLKKARESEAAANIGKCLSVPASKNPHVIAAPRDHRVIEKSNLTGRTGCLNGCRVLIVEDEYFVAHDLQQEFKSLGTTIVGPIGDFSGAKDQIARVAFDVAILDQLAWRTGLSNC